MFKIKIHKKMRLPLTIKIAFAFIVIIFVVMGSYTYYDIVSTRRKMENYEMKNNLSVFTSAMPTIENGLWEVNIQIIINILKQMIENPIITSVAAFNEQGKAVSYLHRNKKEEMNEVLLSNYLPKDKEQELFKSKYNEKSTPIMGIVNKNKDTYIVASPLYIKNTKFNQSNTIKVGFLVMEYSTKHISTATNEIVYKSIILSSLLGVVIIATSFLFLRKLIIVPVTSLEKSSIKISKNEFIQAPLHQSLFGEDELDSLTNNFNYMVKQIIKFIAEEKEQQRMANELETARIIQESFVPKAQKLRVGYFEITSYFKPASECGGDWWHFYPLNNKKVLIMLGDVTGHGTPSAMLTAAVKGYCDSIYARQLNDPGKILGELDIIIRSIGGQDKLMTMFIAILDPVQEKIQYSNAAQNFPYLINKQSDNKITSLIGTGNRLGYINKNQIEKPYFENRTIEFKQNNTLFLYSDGLTEARSENSLEFSERRLKKILMRMNSNDTAEIINSLQNELFKFIGKAKLDDDVTFVACRFCEKEDASYSNEMLSYFLPAQVGTEQENDLKVS